MRKTTHNHINKEQIINIKKELKLRKRRKKLRKSYKEDNYF